MRNSSRAVRALPPAAIAVPAAGSKDRLGEAGAGSLMQEGGPACHGMAG